MALGLDYAAHDATALALLVARGEATALELLEEALARAETANPRLNALTGLRPEVARRMIAAGLPDGPLRGVPFLLKDSGAEAVDFPTSGGSRLLRDTCWPQDSAVYARLRATGLVTFGRTTAPEGAVGAVTEAEAYGGPTRNPWDLSRTPGGSSGGSGAAVTAGIVPAAHGSDGGGSIRIPASNCGLFGFKATRARVPDGPYAGEGWGGMAIEGFLTRSVRDMATLMDAVSGPDLGAPYVAPPLAEGFAASIARPPRRLRVAFCPTRFDGSAIHPDCRAAAEDAAALLASLGHHVEEARPGADVAGMMRAWTLIVACGTALWVRQKLAKLGRTLWQGDVEHRTEAAIRLAETVSGADYLEAIETVHDFGRAMARFMEGWDVLLTSTMGEPPAEIGRFRPVEGDFLDYRLGPNGVLPYSPFAPVMNASGQPAASLPLFWNADGLPIGVQLATRFGEDDLLMALSAEIEAARPWMARRPPGF